MFAHLQSPPGDEASRNDSSLRAAVELLPGDDAPQFLELSTTARSGILMDR
jgi:hypothetical protein